ncbi:MAG: diacylglycerol kinase [Candidatus Pacebacteria bacterium]|nr:diacylglycerol kinase [Candidatus Paceibacterota bacterium]
MFHFKRFVKSISFAGRGLRSAFKEQNFRIQILFSIIVIFFIIFFHLRLWETVVLFMMIVLVLVLEIVNSIFERIVDILEPRVHPYAKNIKDMMAAAVLVASLGALIIGCLIFWPYFRGLI